MRPVPPIVCVITRARGVRGSPERAALVKRMAEAAGAGASMIQVRERHLDDRACVEFTRELIDGTSPTDCCVDQRPSRPCASRGGSWSSSEKRQYFGG